MYLDIRYSGIAKYQNTYWNSTDSIKKKHRIYNKYVEEHWSTTENNQSGLWNGSV